MTIAFPLDESRATAAPTSNQPPTTDHEPPTTDTLTRPKPLSQKKLDANRANAAKSTGPRTKKGKQTAAQNALKHGLRSAIYFQNPPPKTHLCHEESNHPAECGATYATFEQELKEELQPQTLLQHSLFKQIATLAWRLRRLPHTEQEIFARLAPPSEISNPKSQIPTTDNGQPTTDNPPSILHSPSSTPTLPPPCHTLADAFCSGESNPFTLFNRYERSLQNAYLRLLRHYDHLKKHHPTTPVDHSDPLPPEPAWRPPATQTDNDTINDDTNPDTNEQPQSAIGNPQSAIEAPKASPASAGGGIAAPSF